MKRPLEMAHDFLAEVVTKEDIVVDATMGNGHDTLFLAKLAKQVYAFDIQEQAFEKTQERLDQAGLTNAQLILQGHETLDQFVTEAKAGIFNLGYLPSADKSVITRPQTTIEELEKLCHLLVKGGRIGRVTGLLSSLLNIRVVMQMKDHELQPIVKGRGAKTFKKWLDELITSLSERSVAEIGISYSGSSDWAKEMKDNLQPYVEKPISVLETGSIIQTHTGENAWAILVRYNS